MLRRIVFLIGEEALESAEIKASVLETKSYIEEMGYEAELVAFSKEEEVSGYQDDNSNVLFITDSEPLCERISDQGCYVVGLVHELNKGTAFPSARYVFSEISEIDIDSFVKVYQRYAGEPWEILRTDRLIVRETTVDDVDEFYRIYRDPEITRYMEGLFENPEDEKRYQRDYIKKVYGLMGFGVWTLVRKSDGVIIGRAGYSVRSGFDEVELGFLVGRKYQRQGYAKEACSAILEYGRRVLAFEKVQTLVKKENTVSIHMCEGLGFTAMEEVDVEENIYGDGYTDGQKAAPSKDRCGRYVRMLKKFS